MNLYKVFVPIWSAFQKLFLSQVTYKILASYHKAFSILI